MIVTKDELCTGCGVCADACPNNCITIQYDSFGFLKSNIDSEKCVNCKICTTVCPANHPNNENEIFEAYKARRRESSLLLESSSGGIASLISETVIKDGGVVAGCAFDDNLVLRHSIEDKLSELEKFKGSKYVQSYVVGIYKTLKEKLNSGKTAVFIGTPCQVSALKNYLGKDYENLITQDIIYHGVPSDKLWHSYIESLEKPIASGNVSFRNKQNGWKNYSLYIPLENGERIIQSAHDNPFTKAFHNNLSLRKSCYGCHFKHKTRQSDITLADFWGIKFVLPDMNDDKGTSLVVVNSKKGAKVFESVKDNMRIRQVDFNTAVSYNTSMYRSSPRPENREAFLESVNTMGFRAAAKKYLPNGSCWKILLII